VVHYYSDLLAQTLEIADAREYILDRVFDPRWHGPLAASTLRAAMAGLGPAELASFLAGGITKREIAELGRSRRASPSIRSTPTASCSPPAEPALPAGHLVLDLWRRVHQRDAQAGPDPESVTGEAIYRWHPMFAGAGFEVWYHGADAAPATIEGGDVLVLGNGAVLVGMSERTTPQAVEVLAHRLFAAGRPAAWWRSTCRRRARSCTWTRC